MGVRRSGIVVAVALYAAVAWVAGPGASLAGAATGGGECQLQGVANISPPLTNTSASFAYNFTGTLSSCQSNVAGAPTTGNVSAGIQLPETVTLTCAGGTTTGTVQYQEPIPQGSGSCGNSTTAGRLSQRGETASIPSSTTTRLGRWPRCSCRARSSPA